MLPRRAPQWQLFVVLLPLPPLPRPAPLLRTCTVLLIVILLLFQVLVPVLLFELVLLFGAGASFEYLIHVKDNNNKALTSMKYGDVQCHHHQRYRAVGGLLFLLLLLLLLLLHGQDGGRQVWKFRTCMCPRPAGRYNRGLKTKRQYASRYHSLFSATVPVQAHASTLGRPLHNKHNRECNR